MKGRPNYKARSTILSNQIGISVNHLADVTKVLGICRQSAVNMGSMTR